MSKRNLFDELVEGFNAFKSKREGDGMYLLAQEARNKMCIDGHLNVVFDAIMKSNSPDEIFILIGAIASKAIEVTIELSQQEHEGDAHEIWASAQLLPGEGIEDGVDRIKAILLTLVVPSKRIAELEAAMRAYASEFPLTEDGEPDVDNIHANIRKLKAQVMQEPFFRRFATLA